MTNEKPKLHELNWRRDETHDGKPIRTARVGSYLVVEGADGLYGIVTAKANPVTGYNACAFYTDGLALYGWRGLDTIAAQAVLSHIQHTKHPRAAKPRLKKPPKLLNELDWQECDDVVRAANGAKRVAPFRNGYSITEDINGKYHIAGYSGRPEWPNLDPITAQAVLIHLQQPTDDHKDM